MASCGLVIYLDQTNYSHYAFTTFTGLFHNICVQQKSYTKNCVYTHYASQSATNSTTYLQPSIISLVDASGYIQSKNALPATSESFERAQVEHPDTEVATACFMIDCVETTKLGTYSNVWHIHALSSVLHCCIQSAYPLYNKQIRPLFHKKIYPRDCVGMTNALLCYGLENHHHYVLLYIGHPITLLSVQKSLYIILTSTCNKAIREAIICFSVVQSASKQTTVNSFQESITRYAYLSLNHSSMTPSLSTSSTTPSLSTSSTTPSLSTGTTVSAFSTSYSTHTKATLSISTQMLSSSATPTAICHLPTIDNRALMSFEFSSKPKKPRRDRLSNQKQSLINKWLTKPQSQQTSHKIVPPTFPKQTKASKSVLPTYTVSSCSKTGTSAPFTSVSRKMPVEECRTIEATSIFNMVYDFTQRKDYKVHTTVQQTGKTIEHWFLKSANQSVEQAEHQDIEQSPASSSSLLHSQSADHVDTT